MFADFQGLSPLCLFPCQRSSWFWYHVAENLALKMLTNPRRAVLDLGFYILDVAKVIWISTKTTLQVDSDKTSQHVPESFVKPIKSHEITLISQEYTSTIMAKNMNVLSSPRLVRWSIASISGTTKGYSVSQVQLQAPVFGEFYTFSLLLGHNGIFHGIFIRYSWAFHGIHSKKWTVKDASHENHPTIPKWKDPPSFFSVNQRTFYGPCSIAMLNYQRVYIILYIYISSWLLASISGLRTRRNFNTIFEVTIRQATSRIPETRRIAWPFPWVR